MLILSFNPLTDADLFVAQRIRNAIGAHTHWWFVLAFGDLDLAVDLLIDPPQPSYPH